MTPLKKLRDGKEGETEIPISILLPIYGIHSKVDNTAGGCGDRRAKGNIDRFMERILRGIVKGSCVVSSILPVGAFLLIGNGDTFQWLLYLPANNCSRGSEN
jgi:hypothetical protein